MLSFTVISGLMVLPYVADPALAHALALVGELPALDEDAAAVETPLRARLAPPARMAAVRTTLDGANYTFAKSPLGRAEPELSFIAVNAGAAHTIELLLGVGALAALLLLWRRSPSRAVTFTGAALAASMAVMLAGNPLAGQIVAGVALVAGTSLVIATIHVSVAKIRATRTRENEA